MYSADLHIHSGYAMACSPQLTIPNLALWASLKGIDLVGTGDCFHPQHLAQIKLLLQDRGDGIFTLKDSPKELSRVNFLLTTEVACVYSENGRQRRLHIVLMFPSIGMVERVAKALTDRGAKLASDGRPVIGMTVQTLCQIVFEICPKAIVIPAHIWTPWFGLYGDKSGYEFFQECFGPFSDKIYAVETGLSSDPAMNWRVPDLDHKTIVSFSDPHSLPKLGRELTIFKGHLSYDELLDDLKYGNIEQTIEFFPEEGKYHFSGHRKCKVVYDNQELLKKGEVCPVCSNGLTIGVAPRIDELATRSEESLELEEVDGVIKSKTFPNRPGYRKLIPLEEIIAEVVGVSVNSKKVKELYMKMVTTIGNELQILTLLPASAISMVGGPKIAEAVLKVRKGQVEIEPGFDGQYGIIHLLDDSLRLF